MGGDLMVGTGGNWPGSGKGDCGGGVGGKKKWSGGIKGGGGNMEDPRSWDNSNEYKVANLTK